MNYLFGPDFFYGLDAGFELIVMLITLFIAFYSLKSYLITRARPYLYFMLAFLSIAFSYLIRAVIDWLAYTSLIGRMPNVTAALSHVISLPVLHDLGFLAYMFFAFGGFMILLAVYLEITDIWVVAVFLVAAFLMAVLSKSQFLAFHMIMMVMLVFIVIHLMKRYSMNKNFNKFLVLYGFFSLLAAKLFFVLIFFSPFYYIVGHGLQLFGFLLLLFNMLLVMRK